MEVRYNNIIKGYGLYATQKYNKNDIIFVLSGNEYDKPSRETIHIGNNKHIYDQNGIFINHSFTPTIYIDKYNVVALVDIENGNDRSEIYKLAERMEKTTKREL